MSIVLVTSFNGTDNVIRSGARINPSIVNVTSSGNTSSMIIGGKLLQPGSYMVVYNQSELVGNIGTQHVLGLNANLLGESGGVFTNPYQPYSNASSGIFTITQPMYIYTSVTASDTSIVVDVYETDFQDGGNVFTQEAINSKIQVTHLPAHSMGGSFTQAVKDTIKNQFN